MSELSNESSMEGNERENITSKCFKINCQCDQSNNAENANILETSQDKQLSRSSGAIKSVAESGPSGQSEESLLRKGETGNDLKIISSSEDGSVNAESITPCAYGKEPEIRGKLDSKGSPLIPLSIIEAAKGDIRNFEVEAESARVLINDQHQSTVATATPSLSISGLGLLAVQYDSGEDEDMDSSPSSRDSAESIREVIHDGEIDGTYRNTIVEVNSDIEPDSESSNSDVEFVKQSTELKRMVEVDITEEDDYTGSKQKGPVRVKGELLLDDLPPIQDLYITVLENECSELGKVHSIVDQLVLVDSIPGTAAFDLDTVLFLEKGQKVLGTVFDVLGQVSSPLYCVRFNSNKQIMEKEIKVGQTVYIAPKTEYTHFIILKDMMKLRGSDASWENDVEASEKHLDYSDDEEERNARRAIRNRDRCGEEVQFNKRDRPSVSSQRNDQFISRNLSVHQNQRLRFRRNMPGESGNSRYHNTNHSHQTNAAHYQRQFAYGPMNASWHTNYNQPPPYPFAFTLPLPTRMPFTPPTEAMQQPLFPPPSPNQQ